LLSKVVIFCNVMKRIKRGTSELSVKIFFNGKSFLLP
jgi:hypothetical protein